MNETLCDAYNNLGMLPPLAPSVVAMETILYRDEYAYMNEDEICVDVPPVVCLPQHHIDDLIYYYILNCGGLAP